MSNEVEIRIDAEQPDNVGCDNEKCCPQLTLSPNTLAALSEAFRDVLDEFGLVGEVSVSQTIEHIVDNYPDDDDDDDDDDEEDDEDDDEYTTHDDPDTSKCSACKADHRRARREDFGEDDD